MLKFLKYLFFINLGKALSLAVRFAGKGSGSALPGLYAEKYAPTILEFLAKQIPKVILITGTNGKTTSQKVLQEILESSGLKVVSNSTGANLARGIIATLIKSANFLGKIKADVAVFEVEEATMPRIIMALNPFAVIVTNLFRDQLDAYGEVDRTQQFIVDAVKKAPLAQLILNGDDPRVAAIGQYSNKAYYYGLERQSREKFVYETQKLAGVKLDIVADNIKVNSDLSTTFTINNQTFLYKIPGIFHVYNLLAGIYAAKLLGISDASAQKSINKIEPAFGRGEVIETPELTYQLLLVKNPAGMTLTLDLLTHTKVAAIMFLLNDNMADGKDVSWIWDAEIELIKTIKPQVIFCGGTRADDMLLRIKYALGQLERISENTYLHKETDTEVVKIADLKKQVQTVNLHLSGNVHKIDTLYVLPTYTAMLQLRTNLLGKALNE